MIQLENIPCWNNVVRSIADPAGVMDPRNPASNMEWEIETSLRALKKRIEQHYAVRIQDMIVRFEPDQHPELPLPGLPFEQA
jgi:hypothetical protein